MFIDEQKNTFQSLADQTRNLAENTEVMKTQLQEQTRNCYKFSAFEGKVV